MAKITARHLQKLQKCWEAAGGAKASKPSNVSAPRRDITGEKRAIEMAVALPSVGQPGHLKKYGQLVKFFEKLPWASQDAVEKTAERMGLAKKKGLPRIDASPQTRAH